MEKLTLADLRIIAIIVDDFMNNTTDKDVKEVVRKYSEKLHKILKENS